VIKHECKHVRERLTFIYSIAFVLFLGTFSMSSLHFADDESYWEKGSSHSFAASSSPSYDLGSIASSSLGHGPLV